MKKRNRRWRGRREKRRHEPGTPPGTIVVDPLAHPTSVHIVAYGPDKARKGEAGDLDHLAKIVSEWPVTWVRVEGLADAAIIRKIGDFFHFHPLALEDVVNVHQRPKVDDYPDHHFLVTRIPCDWSTSADDPSPGSEQVSLFLGPNYVVSFHERPREMFSAIERRIVESPGKTRRFGPDYLAYAILDAAVDAYFPVLEDISRRIDDLEADLLDHAEPGSISRIHDVKRQLVTLRRAIWPQRDALGSLIRERSPLIRDETIVYLRDCQDHSFQVVELIETYRELGSDMTDLYVSITSNRLNEVMKVLTVIATIFIPLTFIVGVYGMNFDVNASPWNMPELRHPYGYPICLTAMALIAIGLLAYFRAKGWIGAGWKKKPSSELSQGELSPPAADHHAEGKPH